MMTNQSTITEQEIRDQRIAAQFKEVKESTRQIIVPEFDGASAEEIIELYHFMTEVEKDEFDLLLRAAPQRSLMAHQIVPWDLPFWEVMVLIGGRGTGKTVCGASADRDWETI